MGKEYRKTSYKVAIEDDLTKKVVPDPNRLATYNLFPTSYGIPDISKKSGMPFYEFSPKRKGRPPADLDDLRKRIELVKAENPTIKVKEILAAVGISHGLYLKVVRKEVENA